MSKSCVTYYWYSNYHFQLLYPIKTVATTLTYYGNFHIDIVTSTLNWNENNRQFLPYLFQLSLSYSVVTITFAKPVTYIWFMCQLPLLRNAVTIS